MKHTAFYDILGAGFVAALAYLFGALNILLIVLFVFMVIDFITGSLAASITKSFDPSAIFKGGMKKIFILLAVIIGNMFGMMSNTFIEISGYSINYVRESVIAYYIWSEFWSIVKNFGKADVGLPPLLITIAESLGKKVGLKRE